MIRIVVKIGSQIIVNNEKEKISSTKNIKITRIGKILNSRHKSSIIDRNGQLIKINNKGYTHTFD